MLVEGEIDAMRLKDLGLKKVEEPKGGEPKGGEPKTEPQPETEVEQGILDFDDNRVYDMDDRYKIIDIINAHYVEGGD